MGTFERELREIEVSRYILGLLQYSVTRLACLTSHFHFRAVTSDLASYLVTIWDKKYFVVVVDRGGCGSRVERLLVEGLLGRGLWVRVRGDRGGYEGNPQRATKMLRKPHIFYSLSHIDAQFMYFARFLIDYFFIVSLERNDLYLTFRSKTSAVFLCIYCYYKYTAKHMDYNMTYSW